ncbi:scavenger receptor cysteine-rich type 1 protein M130-like [Cyprinus carpio]|uniref:Scavenger receptor cysteine-rich type 1 protein M130-like n=1 Tax=Cyprinus carpio TaxID=7962 RepID=A0A9Q9XKK5_CYPCA|nr:scavenger receptor cysteine-rich type 1 protein M130-like [Cyprinus carpio]
MENCLTLIFLSSVIKLATAGNVRLVGGNNSCAGRVEVYYSGEWGTVCDDYWDLTNTAVVCRELGCDETSNTMRAAHFGPGSGKIWMDDVRCNGSESSILDCSKREMDDHNCKHSEDVGVVCSGIRLVGGSRCSGRLEVPHENTWHKVCATTFDQQDAEVVCRELNCGAPEQVLGAAAFDKGDTQMWTQEIQCRGDEYQFALCPASPSQLCSHENNVSVVCAETVRLVGGNSRCAGRVEVLHDGEWGTVHDGGWDLPDAAVVCRELGCGEALTAPKSAHFGEGSGKVWISDLQCTGSELTLTNCRFSGWGIEANHTKDAGVICSDLSVSTTPATTTSASPPPASPPVLVIVLGVVLLLLLVPLLILIQQNRVMRRALSDWYTGRHRTQTDAVYHEIYHRQHHFTQREEDQEEYDDVKNRNEDERNLDYDDVGEESNKEGRAI